MAPSKSAFVLTRWFAYCLTIVLLLQGSTAWAQDNAILVPPFQGSKPQGLRDLAVKLLKDDGFTVVEGGSGLTAAAGDYSVSDAATDKRAVAVLFVTTSLTKVYWRSTLVVRDGSSGKSVGETTIQSKSYRGLQKAYKDNLVSELIPLFEKCSAGDDKSNAAAASASTATADDASFDDKKGKETEEDDWSSEPSNSESGEDGETSTELDLGPDESEQRRNSLEKKAEALSFTLGPNMVLRSWTINDPLTEANDGPLLPAHDVPAVGFRAGLLLFPTAFFTDNVTKHIGLQLHYAMSLLGETNVQNVTRDPNDTVRDTTLQAFDVGLHVRLPFEPLTLGLIGAYGFDSLVVDGPKDRVAVPDVRAEFVRAGILAQLGFGKTTFGQLGLGYRYVFSFGEEAPQMQSANWFPAALGQGFDARLELRQMLSSTFGLVLGGEWNQYAIDFNVQPDHVSNAANAGLSAPPIAGGATDRYLRFDLSAVVSLGN